jgi:hypothetical protein
MSIYLPPDATQHNCNDRDRAMHCCFDEFPMLRSEILHRRSTAQVAIV